MGDYEQGEWDQLGDDAVEAPKRSREQVARK